MFLEALPSAEADGCWQWHRFRDCARLLGRRLDQCPLLGATLGNDEASARRKRGQRRQVLRDAGFDPTPLKSIDAVVAALCALTAKCVLLGHSKVYGDAEGGYIFVPEPLRMS